MRHTLDPLTDVIGHFSRQSRRIALCAGLGLLLILGSLGYGSYRLYDLSTAIGLSMYQLQTTEDQLRTTKDEVRKAEDDLSRLQRAIADTSAVLESIRTQDGFKAAYRPLPEKQRTAVDQMLTTIVVSSAAKLWKSAPDHWGWYAVLASYKTEKDARSAASRAVNLEGLRGDIIGVYLAENAYYAVTLGGEFTDRNEAQGKVEKAKPAFDGAYLRHGKNWIKVPEAGGSDAAKWAGPAKRQQ